MGNIMESVVKAVGSYIIVETVEPKEKKVGKIFLLGNSDIKTSKDNKAITYNEGIVISMGPRIDKSEYKEGDEVIYSGDSRLELATMTTGEGIVKHYMIHGGDVMLVKVAPQSEPIDRRVII
jgi:hypothetical protein